MRFFLVLVCLGLSGCGYQFGQGMLPSQYCTVTVPYICGDKTGEMTYALIREISRSGALSYRNGSADLSLKVTIIDLYENNIGYRYHCDDHLRDLEKDGCRPHHFSDSIIPTETRLTAIAEVSVIDMSTGSLRLGPGRIKASVDYDHDYYFSPDGINQKSLGQLTNMESAKEAVIHPLSEVLAQKIVDYVIHSW
jgi:hypothetical protein